MATMLLMMALPSTAVTRPGFLGRGRTRFVLPFTIISELFWSSATGVTLIASRASLSRLAYSRVSIAPDNFFWNAANNDRLSPWSSSSRENNSLRSKSSPSTPAPVADIFDASSACFTIRVAWSSRSLASRRASRHVLVSCRSCLVSRSARSALLRRSESLELVASFFLHNMISACNASFRFSFLSISADSIASLS